jgi:hypothetical protein
LKFWLLRAVKNDPNDSFKYRLSALVIVFSPDEEGSGFLRNS